MANKVSKHRKARAEKMRRERWSNLGIIGGLRLARANVDKVQHMNVGHASLQELLPLARKIEEDIEILQEKVREAFEAHNEDQKWLHFHTPDPTDLGDAKVTTEKD
jgi:hypothetical protein